jgi:hypothetical protein
MPAITLDQNNLRIPAPLYMCVMRGFPALSFYLIP